MLDEAALLLGAYRVQKIWWRLGCTTEVASCPTTFLFAHLSSRAHGVGLPNECKPKRVRVQGQLLKNIKGGQSGRWPTDSDTSIEHSQPSITLSSLNSDPLTSTSFLHIPTMAQSQDVTSPAPTVVPIPSPTKNVKSIDMTRETTISPSSPSKTSGLDNVRQKLQPLFLYVVSTAQFLDIGR